MRISSGATLKVLADASAITFIYLKTEMLFFA
jgi:hypothetical protein